MKIGGVFIYFKLQSNCWNNSIKKKKVLALYYTCKTKFCGFMVGFMQLSNIKCSSDSEKCDNECTPCAPEVYQLIKQNRQSEAQILITIFKPYDLAVIQVFCYCYNCNHTHEKIT